MPEAAAAIVAGLALGWLISGLIWFAVARLFDYWPRLLDFYCIWRWKRGLP